MDVANINEIEIKLIIYSKLILWGSIKLRIEEFLTANSKEDYLKIYEQMKSNKIDFELYILTKIFYCYVIKNRKYHKYIELIDIFKEIDSTIKVQKISKKISDRKLLKSRLVVDNIKLLVKRYNKETDIIKKLNILVHLKYLDVDIRRIAKDIIENNLYGFIVQSEVHVIINGEKKKVEPRISIDLKSVKEQCEMVKSDENLFLYITNPDIKVQIEAVRKNPILKKYIKDKVLGEELTEEYMVDGGDKVKSYIQNEVKKEAYINERAEINSKYIFYNDKVIKLDKYKKIIDDVSRGKGKFKSIVIEGNENLGEYINFICRYIKSHKIDIAMGYVFDSGLTLLEETFDFILNNKGVCNLVVGNLQNYNKGNQKEKIRLDITSNTVHKLNKFISEGISIRTLNDRFYHGKIMLLEGENVNVVIMGSSNISASAYLENYEINTLFVFNKNSIEFNQYRSWFDVFWSKCDIINFIDINQIEAINFDIKSTSRKVNNNDMIKIIDNIEDKAIKERFNYWLNKNPYMIHKNLGIKSLENYMAFEYSNKLIVFDSYYLGNSYYYFYGYDLEELLRVLKNCSKTEIFNMSNMSKRGYHINDEDKLNKIRDNIFEVVH